ncbi:histidyl-tRNA synthetase [Mycoplasma testudineum]|uniref:Histidine--tRNA ligase n=1 Tax=Mycoplasma testudineum TaxID=244584 RepID=A0A4R6IE55_9MOLU|nr:histidine--tRNA ligase [Mycoplasma testudineum]OYD27005.1 histidine--tRNA ligase [Mycoplasma testudineum]TDO20553.1 histidyl-tRNA synthetase [Mycoplasma testudineum]
MKYIKPKGTSDFIGIDSEKYQFIYESFKSISNQYGFSFIETPIFENSELFKRTSGENSDIVNKELYEFQDKSNRNFALRPEGTAPVLRALLESKETFPFRKFYFGPMFRYERPQKGRYRQFYQGGLEWVSDLDTKYKYEVLFLALDFLKKINLNNFKIKINWLSSFEQRRKYINELKEYFQKFKSMLEPISLKRLDKNPLRILDDKIEMQKDFVKQAPLIKDYISGEEIVILEFIKNKIQEYHQEIKVEIDYRLVRGIDYYTDIVFEFVDNETELTLLAGGAYSNLLSDLGGENIQGIGFAFGLERLMDLINLNQKRQLKICAYATNELELENIIEYRNLFRNLNYSYVEKIINHNKAFRYKEIKNADLILYFDALQNSYILKNLLTKEVYKISKTTSVFEIKKIIEEQSERIK